MPAKESDPATRSLVRYRDEAQSIACPYGHVQRIVTGGEGGVANVHVVSVSEGNLHVHEDYHEVYYVLKGKGSVVLSAQSHALRPGTVVVIPAGTPHSLHAEPGEPLEFVIFGTPPLPIEDPRARPHRPEG